MKAALFDALVAAGRRKRPVATVTDLNDGAQALVTADSVTGSLSLDAAQIAESRAMLAGEASGLLREAASPGGDGPRLFVHVYALPRRLVIVGAVHIAQALAPMARL
ncbi:MAG: xanthine dehydrogenase, partial [Alphaproteobacteria bacterium]